MFNELADMKKILVFLSFVLFFLGSVGSVAALELTKIGTIDLSGAGIGTTVSTYSYPFNSFTLYGNAVASSSVAIKIDDVTYNATANQTGAWSSYLSGLTYDSHAVAITAPDQTGLNFTLIISSPSATTTPVPTAVPTASQTTSSTSSELPASGTLENTFLSALFALFLIGLGVAVKYKD